MLEPYDNPFWDFSNGGEKRKQKKWNKISAHVDRGQSGGSLVRGPGSDDPHRCERKSSSFLAPVTKIPEGVVIGFRNFTWAPK